MLDPTNIITPGGVGVKPFATGLMRGIARSVDGLGNASTVKDMADRVRGTEPETKIYGFVLSMPDTRFGRALQLKGHVDANAVKRAKEEARRFAREHAEAAGCDPTNTSITYAEGA